MKECSKCKLNKCTSLFYKDSSRSDGLQKLCKPCDNDRVRERKKRTGYKESPEKSKRWRAKNKSKTRFQRIKRKYNIDEEGFNDILESQGNSCEICKSSEWLPVVDHDHLTGSVRGLLCSNCNTALGLLKENEDSVMGLLNYIRKYKIYHVRVLEPLRG